MKAEIKSRWLAALRSGKFKQGRNALRNIFSESGNAADTFCCLGVLCELAREEGVVTFRVDGRGSLPVGVYGTSQYYLSPDVQKWAGLKSDNPLVNTDKSGSGDHLGVLNDVDGWDFNHIADAIEKEKTL